MLASGTPPWKTHQQSQKGIEEMKRISDLRALIVGLVFSLALPASTFAAAEDAIGTWKDTETGGVCSIYSCPGGICVKVLTPSKGHETDTYNPDPALKGRSMAGVVLMSGAVKDGADRWKGELYNSEDGKTYSGWVIVNSKNEVKLEGCVLAGIICKSRIWQRAQ
jgi:uncharacterized protein (DUF2147 family)